MLGRLPGDRRRRSQEERGCLVSFQGTFQASFKGSFKGNPLKDPLWNS